MPDILLINPNTSADTTTMMVEIAAGALPNGFRVQGATAARGAPMIVDEDEMAFAAAEVQRTWARSAAERAGAGWHGVIVSAFGDPGIGQVRASAAVPVVGICEASLLEAAQGGRRFGIATVTPDLADLIGRCVAQLGLAPVYTGIRLTEAPPRALAADPQALEDALAEAVRRCIEDDGAEAVVIGGGPLGRAAAALQSRWNVPVIAPIPAAARRLLALLGQA